MSRSQLSGRSEPRLSRCVFRLLSALLVPLLCGCGAAGTASPNTPLKSGFLQERDIGAQDTHVYPLQLQAGQFLQVSVQEDGIDLTVQITDSGGAARAGVDSLPTAEALEELAFVATEGGGYELRVIAPEKVRPGRYRLHVEALREPQKQDRLRAEAVEATWKGHHVAGVAADDQIRFLERASRLWQDLGNVTKTAEVLYLLGNERIPLGRYDQAVSDFQRSASAWGQFPTKAAKLLQAKTLKEAGRCLGRLERREEARGAYQKALALARDLERIELQAAILNVLGQLEVEDGEILSGIELQLRALELVRQTPDRKTEAVIRNNLGTAYEQIAETQKALEYYQQALDLARQASNPKAEMIYLSNLGLTYRSLGDWEKASDCHQRSAELSEALGDHDLTSKILINLSGVYRQRGQLAEAWGSLDRALSLSCQIDSRQTQIFALGHLAFLLLQLKQPAQAVEYASRAVDLKGSLEDRTFSRYALGSAFRDLGETNLARTELMKSRELAHTRGDGAREAEINLALARMDREDGNLDSAFRRVRSAIDLIESQRGGVVDLELKTSFLASKQDYYELEIDILMDLHTRRPTDGFAADALRTSEWARARGLLDILNEAKADVRKGMDPALLHKEHKIRERLNERDFQLRELKSQENPDREKLAEAQRKRDQAVDEYQDIQVELRQSSPRYAALTQPQPLNVAEIQAQILDGEASLLEYSLGTQRSILWVVTPDSVTSFELPGRKRIEDATRRWYELLTVRGNKRPSETLPAWKKRIAESDAEAVKAGRELAELILRPAEKLLSSRTLLIVADGALQYIPFAALPVPSTGDLLVGSHEVVNLPSASVLAVMRRELQAPRSPSRTLAIFADPVFEKDDERLVRGLVRLASTPLTLPFPIQRGGNAEESREKGIDLSALRRLGHSGKEAEAIAALLPPSEVFKAMGFAASRSAVSDGGLTEYRVVHFATHGVLDSQDPEFSGLVLSLYDERGERQDGFLRLNDIYNLRLDAELVVLSACRTALGQEIRGEGLVGLTRGFMYAGAARVLASLWSVEDRATAELMVSFYRGMLQEELSPTAALRQAQLAMARAGKSPYYWAGFSLQGEWR